MFIKIASIELYLHKDLSLTSNKAVPAQYVHTNHADEI